MWKYEYRRGRIADADLESQCNLGGAQGWRLRFQRWDADANAWDCFFEHIVTNREQLLAAWHRPLSEAEHQAIVDAVSR